MKTSFAKRTALIVLLLVITEWRLVADALFGNRLHTGPGADGRT